jgi:hypothetical protein
MQDYIALQFRREPVAIGRTFVVFALLFGLVAGGVVALS